MKYDSQIVDLKNLLPTAKNILIVLPVSSDIDRLAAGLSLFLLLTQQGKEVVISCEDTIKVTQSHLFGIDHIQKNIPLTNGGNFILTLEGVAVPDPGSETGWKIPSLEKLDYFPENNNLNLIFHVLPGQTFQPSRVTPHYQGSGFNVIFIVGAVNLNSLGNIYLQNQQVFQGAHIVNIDNQSSNTGFGSTNVIDPDTSFLSEMMMYLISDLGLSLDGDSATNLLSGIFESSGNLTNHSIGASTYLAVANLLQAGGQKPKLSEGSAPSGLDLSALIKPSPAQGNSEPFPTPTVVDSDHPSPEERPADEGVISENPEPDWLTPKIYKGTSIG